ncbi:MAG: hypothetical protein PQJ46_06555 [Spirochaetales bacterium]|nr:hypothetical protein [Spirochaetales bacterium]
MADKGYNMNQLPSIYVLNDLPSLGEIGEKTKSIFNIECATCNRRTIEYNPFSYVFARWNGEDLISVAGNEYFVSKRLKLELEPKVKDLVNFVPIINEKKEYFKMGKSAYQKTIPPFFRLEITHNIDGPELWWERNEQCPACGKYKWWPTLKGIESTITSAPTATYTPRQVYFKDWKGEAIFNLNDPGKPIVTQEFIDTVNNVCIKKIKLKPAEWVL